MTQSSKQPNPKSNPKPRELKLTPEEQAVVDRTRTKIESKKVEPEWMLVAKFGYHFGYKGIEAIFNNEISLDEVKELNAAAHKLHYGQMIELAEVVFTATRAASASKGTQATKIMNAGLKKFLKEANNG